MASTEVQNLLSRALAQQGELFAKRLEERDQSIATLAQQVRDLSQQLLAMRTSHEQSMTQLGDSVRKSFDALEKSLRS